MKKTLANIQQFMFNKAFAIEAFDNFESRFDRYLVLDLPLLLDFCEFLTKPCHVGPHVSWVSVDTLDSPDFPHPRRQVLSIASTHNEEQHGHPFFHTSKRSRGPTTIKYDWCSFAVRYIGIIPSETAYIRGVFPSVSAMLASGMFVAVSKSTIHVSPFAAAKLRTVWKSKDT